MFWFSLDSFSRSFSVKIITVVCRVDSPFFYNFVVFSVLVMSSFSSKVLKSIVIIYDGTKNFLRRVVLLGIPEKN